MTEKILHIGLCLPKSCTHDHVKILTQNLFDKSPTSFLLVYEMKPKVLEVKNLKFRPRFLLKKSFLSLVTCFVVATLLSRLASNLERHIKFDENNNIALGTENEIKLSRVDNFIRCFNYAESKKWILSREPSKMAVNSISGLRSISCFLIAITHVCTFSHFKLFNKVSYLDQAETFLGLLLLNAALLVDGYVNEMIHTPIFVCHLNSSFFVISGYLFASNLLRDCERVNKIKSNNLLQNIKLYGKLMLQRYIRLTPVYVVSILMSDVVSSLLDDVSVHRQFFRDDLTCQQWVVWRSLLTRFQLIKFTEIGGKISSTSTTCFLLSMSFA